MQCGVACLQMICRYFGKKYSAKGISCICAATAEGVSLLGITDAANILGLSSECQRTTIEHLKKIWHPAILHWNQNHFVVLYKVKNGKTFYIADPGKGLVRYNLEEFKKHWISTKSDGEKKGIAMFIEPTSEFYKNTFCEGDKNEQRSFKFLFGYIKNIVDILVKLLWGCSWAVCYNLSCLSSHNPSWTWASRTRTSALFG